MLILHEEQCGLCHMESEQVDTIIVGQGLAGSSLALQLLQQGERIWVIDCPESNRSSRVAAGLFNPITGMGSVKTWLADPIFLYLHQFYLAAEKRLGKRFFFPQSLYRPFGSIEEQNNWLVKSVDSSVQYLLEGVYTQSHFSDDVCDELGGVLIKEAGYLDTHIFLDAVKNELMGLHAYHSAYFEWQRMVIEKNTIKYDNIVAKRIVMCTGINTLSPYFEWLPIRPLKGEILVLTLDRSPATLLNKGVYVVPTSESTIYKAGATYSLIDLSTQATESGKNELESKLNALLKIPYHIIDQEWGIRPTTVDRKPILGAHPNHPNLIIFNGLGTKGVSLAPYFSRQLAHWMAGKGEIIREANINRFKPVY